MATYLEHNNITVSDLNHAIEFFTDVFPDWKLRHRSYLNPELKDIEWAHVGNPRSYLALQAPPSGQKYKRAESPYFDHMGIIVEDLNAIRERLNKYDYRIRENEDTKGFKRIYAYIFDGIILEIIQYLSEDIEVKNQYTY